MDLLAAVSLPRLRSFLAVCGTMHMARAAEALGVAQPSLSQQIRGLETGLGVRLFHRRKRGIDLTAAGEACRREAEALLAAHAHAVDLVRQVARGEAGALSIGYVSSAMFDDRFPAQLRRLRREAPGIALRLREGTIGALLAALEAGEADAVLVRAPVRLAPPLRHRLHSRQRLMVVLPEGHDLAARAEIGLHDLAGEKMIGFSDPGLGITQAAQALSAAAGAELQVAWQAPDLLSVLGLAAAGLGFGIVPETSTLLARPGVVSRPLSEPGAHSELCVAWREPPHSAALSRFLKIVEDSAGA